MKKIYLTLICLITWISSFSQSVSVLTYRYDDRRLGWNNSESILTPDTVNANNFGLIFSRMVDDDVYAQPLLVSNLLINKVKQNVVFIATVNNSVYAYNADDPLAVAPLWHSNLTTPGARVFRKSDLPCAGFKNNIGIVGTPVIDTTTFTMYVLSHDVSLTSGKSQQYIHAIDIRTGLEKPGSPAAIIASYPGNGDGSVNDTIRFDQNKHNQRTALLLHNGVVYACWASHCDNPPYHGWVIGFDAKTLKNKYVYNNTPLGSDGGIWMAGNAPSVDDNGYIYIISGNGDVGFGNNPNNPIGRGESLLKFLPTADSLKLVDFFTPDNFVYLEKNDLDYGIGGAVLIPHSSLSVSNSKEGKIFLLDDNRLGKYSAGNDSMLQSIKVVPESFSDWTDYGTPVYYHYFSTSDTECVYVWSAKSQLTQLFFDRSAKMFDTLQTIKGASTPYQSTNYGPVLTLSSNDTIAGTGILWALVPKAGNGNPAVLEAYDARDIRKLLWSSDMGPAANKIQNLAKFNTPVVANGKVYVPTFSNKLEVYGLLSKNPVGIPASAEILKVNGLFPNPADKNIELQYSITQPLNNLSLQVVDIYGRQLENIPLEKQPGEHAQTILLDNKYVAGIYTAVILTDNQIIGTYRFIKR